MKRGWLVALVILAAHSVVAGAGQAVTQTLEDMARWGLFDPQILERDMSQAVTGGVFDGLVQEAFGAWLDQPSVSTAGTGVGSHVSGDEAVSQLNAVIRAVRGRLGWRAYGSRAGIRFLLQSLTATRHIRGYVGRAGEVSIQQALEAIRWLLLLLPCPPGAPSPAEAVRRYYRALTEGTGGIARQGALPLFPVCGAAARNINRNLKVLTSSSGGRGVCLALSSLKIESEKRRGMFAEVSAQRRMFTVVGLHRTEDSGQVSFSLRLSPSGWLIFE